MKLEKARSVAEQLVAAMAPFCDRVEIAGSIRREKPEVKDIEIVALGKRAPEPILGDLFGGTRDANLLHRWAVAAVATGESSAAAIGLQWIKTGTPERVPWIPKEDGRYWRGFLPEHDINLDLFLPESSRNFGVIKLIRTGSAEFSTAVAMHAQRSRLRFEGGWLWEGTQRIDTPEEIDVFRELNLAWVEPQDRHGVNDVRNAAPGAYADCLPTCLPAPEVR